MKKLIAMLSYFVIISTANSQESIDDLLAAGIDDAKRFSTAYFTPATDGIAYGINAGWFNKAKAPKRFGIEISIVGNASFIKSENKSFTMVATDYENVRFEDGSTSRTVATALGNNDPDVVVVVTYDDPIFADQEVELTLPTGIGAEGVNLIPTAFLQASFSPFKGTQVKGRFFPKIKTDEVDLGLYGFGIQQEFTAWLPAHNIFPVAISGLVAYTHLNGSYDFTETNIVEGENQQVETEVNTLLFQLIAGTKLKVINFYGAVGYLDGKATTNLSGVYRVSDGTTTSANIVNPFSIDSKTSGVTTTLGANLKLGFFGLNASYTIAEFDNVSVGLNFSFN